MFALLILTDVYLHFFSDVYNQILSTLTLSHMTKIFDQRKNFDLRRLLAGSERLIDHLLTNDSQKRACNKSMQTIVSIYSSFHNNVPTIIISTMCF